MHLDLFCAEPAIGQSRICIPLISISEYNKGLQVCSFSARGLCSTEHSSLSKSSGMPLCKACPDCGGIVHIRKVSCSCGHVFVAKHNKHRVESIHRVALEP